MEINQLIQIIKFLTQISENPELFKYYNELYIAIKKVIDGNGKQNTQAITKANENLISLLKETDSNDFGPAAHKLFQKIDKDKLFGNEAVQYFQQVLQSEEINYKELSKEIERRIKLSNELNKLIYQLNEMFTHLLEDELIESDNKNTFKSILYLYFEGNVTVKNISDLGKYTRIWDGIIKSFTEITGDTNEASEIHQVNKKFMANSIVAREADSATKMAQKLINQYQPDTLQSENSFSNLCKSLWLILNFIEKGGKIECKFANQTEQENSWNKKLHSAYLQVPMLLKHCDKIEEIKILQENIV